LALRFTRQSTIDRNLMMMQGWGPVKLKDYRTLLAGTKEVLLIHSEGPYGWLTDKLAADHATLAVLARNGKSTLYFVKLP
jgi:hypothetical protein